MLRINLLLLCCILTVTIGCADRKNYSPFPTVSEEAKAGLKQPVNCKTAREDLRILEEEKASVGKQILAGVRSVLPISAAAGILMGDYRDRVTVATGMYNSDLEIKISEIRVACNILQ